MCSGDYFRHWNWPKSLLISGPPFLKICTNTKGAKSKVGSRWGEKVGWVQMTVGGQGLADPIREHLCHAGLLRPFCQCISPDRWQWVGHYAWDAWAPFSQETTEQDARLPSKEIMIEALLKSVMVISGKPLGKKKRQLCLLSQQQYILYLCLPGPDQPGRIDFNV